MQLFALVSLLTLIPGLAQASNGLGDVLDPTSSPVGYLAIAFFVGAYVLVILEEQIHLPKSKPVLIAAGLIWLLIAITYQGTGMEGLAEEAVRHNLLEFSELMLFLSFSATTIFIPHQYNYM